ncbi:MAG: AMIN domain-containing protein [Methylacidiphilales bacterium]|nr:AMIN domain-containing protein [Candidatus Methylacidiphilales bacterium]
MAWDNWRLSVGASSIISLLASQPVLAAPVPITDVELYDTDKGIEIVLKIPQQASLIPKTSVEDKTFIVTIPNTQLQLTGRKSFVTKNPTAEIAEIFISQVDPNTVEIEVTGVKNLPKVNIRQKGQEFSVDIISETPTETPTPTPTLTSTTNRNTNTIPNTNSTTNRNTPTTGK